MRTQFPRCPAAGPLDALTGAAPFAPYPTRTTSRGTPPRTGVVPPEVMRSNTVTPMAGTDIESKGADEPALPPRELVSEIERTRADLARTIDEIADRVSPSNV